MNNCKRFSFLFAGLLFVHFASAATLELSDDSVQSAGFADSTATEPVGGNEGLTRGQQRLNAVYFVLDLWGDVLESNIPIRVEATFANLTCSPTVATLATTLSPPVMRAAPGLPTNDIWYPAALANALADTELFPVQAQDHIQMQFNNRLDTSATCLGGSDWYYGFDGNAPAGDYDFVTVVAHELAHGLGMTTYMSESGVFAGGLFQPRYPSIYAVHSFNNATQKSFPEMTEAERAEAITSPGDLVWSGLNAVTVADASLDSGQVDAGYLQLYAPAQYNAGSTWTHFDTTISPWSLMRYNMPSGTSISKGFNLTTAVMSDMGWDLVDGDGDLIPDRFDTCTALENIDQIDADGDGYGNSCDADFNNDGIVNFVDLGYFRSKIFTNDPVADLNSDGAVNFVDLGIFKQLVFEAPGPSGLNP